ncbi:MAG: Gfo/Idh/MocA family protein [bacterium]
MHSNIPLKIGLIGCGRFGQFCLRMYAELQQVRVVAVADLDDKLVEKVAGEFGVAAYTDPARLIQREDVEMVHVATPPFLHFSLGLQAARGRKHVLCEKPLCLTLDQADEMLACARQQNLIMPVDFVLRYLPIVSLVERVIQSKILGAPLHAYFENYATDEHLGENHWFWDKRKSGGIFVEHGVHFFDLYRYWFGEAVVLSAHSEVRPGTEQEDRVTCLLRHASGVVANHYHGFDQPACLDRATHRILFETGDVTVNGWIPESCTIHALIDERQATKLQALCPEARLAVLETLMKSDLPLRGRGKAIKATKRIALRYQAPVDKGTLYARGVSDLVLDQVAYIRDRAHERIVAEENGRQALALALQASQLASA